MLLHEVRKPSPGKTSLIDRVTLWEPLDIALADQERSEFAFVSSHDDFKVFVCDHSGIDLDANFVSH